MNAKSFNDKPLNDKPLSDKIILIAGNRQELAGVLARAFVLAGSCAVIVAARAGELSRARQNEAEVTYEEVELDDAQQCAALVGRIVERYGRLDILVNAPELKLVGPAESLPSTLWEERLARILAVAFYCAQAAGRQMLSQGQGVIVNLTSVVGIKAVEGHVAGTMLHAALQGMTNALGVEWAGRGVRVVGVALPLELAPEVGPATDGQIQEASRRTPLRQAVTPQHIANTVLYLTSDAAAYLTAETIRVDGSWSAYQLF